MPAVWITQVTRPDGWELLYDRTTGRMSEATDHGEF